MVSTAIENYDPTVLTCELSASRQLHSELQECWSNQPMSQLLP